MTRIRFLLALTCGAVALTVLAAPTLASASGGPWTKYSAPLSEPAHLNLGGPIGFITAYGGIECIAEATATLEAPQGGSLSEFEISENCQGSGFLAGCETVLAEENGPWPLNAGKETAAVEGGVSLWEEYDASCPFGELIAEFDSLTLTPDNPSGFSDLSVSGEGTVYVAGVELEAEATGRLDSPLPGAYGIGGLLEPGKMGQWTKEGTALTKAATVGVATTVLSQGPNWSFACPATGKATLEPGSGYAEVSYDPINLSNCVGTGSLGGCEATSIKANLPHVMAAYEDTAAKHRYVGLSTHDATGEKIGYDVEWKFDEGCAWPSLHVIGGEPFLKGEADNGKAISSLSGWAETEYPQMNVGTSEPFKFSFMPAKTYGMQ